MNKTKFLVQAAIIAAIYATLTVALIPFSYNIMQVRVSEALTILPFFTSAAIPGLFVGCLISNIVGGLGLLDIVIGSTATLLAAIATYYIKNRVLAPLPAVVINGLIVGTMLSYLLNVPLLISIGWVSLGQLIACYGLGYPLLLGLEKYKKKLFE